jgi:hypothetical protein
MLIQQDWQLARCAQQGIIVRLVQQLLRHVQVVLLLEVDKLLVSLVVQVLPVLVQLLLQALHVR